MSVIAPNPSIIHRGFYSREHHSYSNHTSACINTPANVGGMHAVCRNGSRRESRLRAFWDTRPMSIEMDHITTLEELEEILSSSKELSQPILVDWSV